VAIQLSSKGGVDNHPRKGDTIPKDRLDKLESVMMPLSLFTAFT
jgi:hypothetical protein